MRLGRYTWPIAAGVGAVTVAALWLTVAQVSPWAPTAASPQERAAHRATLDRYCVDCHSRAILEAGLNLEDLDVADLEQNGIVWEKMLRKLRSREMPPDLPRPTPETYDALVTFIEAERDRIAEARPNPGRPTLRRLNRVEYANAVRDLLALEIDAAELLRRTASGASSSSASGRRRRPDRPPSARGAAGLG